MQDQPVGPLDPEELRKINAYWRAANYLSVGQIYLLENPLLRTPLRTEQIKPRLLGHWGTTPGLNFIYVHMNRVIRQHNLNAIYVCGPGHGGPGMVANTYLEGTYSELYPNISRNEEGMQRLFKQFSFPGGIPSHAAPETPGSIHEGGELGYALVHDIGIVAFDEVAFVAVAFEERGQFIVGDAGEHGGAGDLVAVQMEDGKHGSVAHRIQEFIRMPTGGAGSGFGLAIAHHAAGEEIGIIEHGAVSMQERVAEFAAFMDGTGCLRGGVAGDAAGKRELLEEALHTLFISRNVRI